MASLQPADDEGHTIDPAQPLRGTVACCTSIPPDQRTDIAARVEELGGLHKYDLTPDVTHLIVGAYDTPKYRHVARERPDIKAMDAAWIEDLAHLWKNDEAIDFVALEKKHQLKALEKCGAESPSPLQGQSTERQSLLICLTGFGEQREDIASRIKANGGRYTGDLTRRCTHLIVDKPEGKKYAAAKSWDVYTVTLDWLDQTIERGMILEETRFDPLLPVKEQGIGAWVKRDPNTLGKRSRSFASNGTEDKGVRKLRKTASMKLSSQRNTLWGDILGRSGSMEHSFAKDNISAEAPDTTIRPQYHVEPYERTPNEGILARCIFAIHGFNDKRHTVLEDTITTLGGSVVSSLREIAMRATPPGQSQQSHRFLVVPQISEASSHPNLPSDDVEVVTEFFLERCLHSKQFIHPSQHVLGRPFPVFPIPGFSKLVVCSAAFTGLDLNQIARSTSQLGAKFEEEFRRTTSVLVCRSLSAMRKEKLKYAIQWGVPIVSADWLWECISTGFNVPIDNFIYPELRDRYGSRTPPEMEMNDRSSPSITKSNPRSERPSRPKIIGGFDARDFDEDFPEQSPDSNSKPASKATGTFSRPDLPTSADFLADKSRPGGASDEQKKTPPLAELSGAQLNKSSSSSKQAIAPSGRTRSAPIPGEGFENPTKANRSPSVPPQDLSRDATVAAAAVETGDDVTGGGDSQTAVDEDGVRRREEAARQQRKESERQALSSKLSDLIQVTAGTVSSDSNSSLAQATSTRPRRRQLLGRAVSNVSNASSAASYNGDGAGSGPRQMTDSLRAAVAAGTDDDDDMKRHEAQPPATQLEYADPEAMQMKQEIMNRMMGKASHEGKGAIIDDTNATQTMLGRRSSLRKR